MAYSKYVPEPASKPPQAASRNAGQRARLSAHWAFPGLCAAALGVLSACQTPPPATPAAPATAPMRAPAGSLHYQVDGARSQVLVLVGKEGSAAALGHTHVMSIRDLAGDVWWAPDPAQSVLELRFPVSAIVIDDPVLKKAQRPDYQDEVTPAGIEGTREHMLAFELLDAADFPAISLRASGLVRVGQGWRLTVAITVRDHTVSIETPVSLQQSAEEIVASGEFTVTHQQLGLTVHSAMLGAMRVAEALPIRFSVVATRG
jgi:YceI-like domain